MPGRMFNRVIRRNLSFSSLAESFNSTASVETKLPQVTGNGPFAAAPSFEAVGSPPSLLSIKLPASSILNLRLTTKSSIVGLNGDVQNMTKETTVLNSPLKPLLYQKIFNPSPLSLLISNHLNFQNFMVLKTNGSQNWFIQNSSLVGWHGVEIKPHLTKDKFLNQFGVLEATSEGTIALKGSGALFQIQLNDGESIYVSPTNLVAYNTESITVTSRPAKMLINFKVPDFKLRENISILSYKLQKWASQYSGPSDSTATGGIESGDLKANSDSTVPKKVEPELTVQVHSQVPGRTLITRAQNWYRNRQEEKVSDKLIKVSGKATLIVQNNI